MLPWTVVIVSLIAGRVWAAGPENLARSAVVSASSEHSAHYQARFAVDGRVPAAGSGARDLDAAWCVLKSRSGDHADFTLQWPKPVEIAEIVYWGRTSFYLNECWKDYEVYLDDAGQPAAHGRFQMLHGPQRIALPRSHVRKITLKFLNSYGGFNPGAAEIQVFAHSPTPQELTASVTPLGRSRGGDELADMSWVNRCDPGKLSWLIQQLTALHGLRYGQAAEHRTRLEVLQQALEIARPAHDTPRIAQLEKELAELQRSVLLWDVEELIVIQRHEIHASHVYTYHYEGFRAGGGLYRVSLQSGEPQLKQIVASPEGQILDCDLSYDGRTVLFSWRQEEKEGYHLWKVNVDGTGLTQLTHGHWHDYNGCWLPDGGIAFLSTRAPQFAYCWHAPVGVLCRMQADGSGFRKLSANYLNDFTPYPLDDGRIVYTRWEYVDRPAIPIQSLWSINPDGTGLTGFFGNRKISPGTFMEARQIPGTTKIVCTMTGHNGPTRGALGVIDRSRGMNAQQSIENITPDVPVPNVDQGNGNTSGTKQYSCPLPLDNLRLLCSIRGPVLVRTFSGECQAIALPSPGNDLQYFCARPIRPRPRPPVIPSRLPAGETEKMATVYLQDVYNGLEPYVPRGEVQAIRVVREMPKSVRIDPQLRAFGFQFPVISCGATYAGKQVLGEVPVERDGSACFRVPSGIPIYFMALDADGRAVQRMRSFTHFMPGEVHGCIGCHEHRREASRARVSVAYNRQPRELSPPEWGTEGFDYSRIVQPVLDRYCVECHNAVDPAGRVDLTGGKTDFFNVSYETLARENQGRRGSPYVTWIPTYNGQEQNILEITPKAWGSPASKLADLLLSGHPDAQGKPQIRIDDRSRRRVLAWIDLNVPYYGSSETAYPDRPGCRQILPEGLEKTLTDMGRRRCAECHSGGKFPRRVWVRITEPELNPFLLAPLARSAGGSQKCGKAVFADKSDADYQAIRVLFEPNEAMLKARPRMDMPGGEPAADVCRSCQ
jgi:hypothetical protein